MEQRLKGGDAALTTTPRAVLTRPRPADDGRVDEFRQGVAQALLPSKPVTQSMSLPQQSLPSPCLLSQCPSLDKQFLSVEDLLAREDAVLIANAMLKTKHLVNTTGLICNFVDGYEGYTFV